MRGVDIDVGGNLSGPDLGAVLSARRIQEREGPRIDSALADINNEPDKLVSRGALSVPLLHIWNHSDENTCGSPPISCPLRNGTHVTMGLTDCIHEPMAAAIAAEGPDSKSMNLPVCVNGPTQPACSTHVVTNKPGLVNTDPTTPADYLGAIMTWVHARLADPAPTTASS